ncbi:GABA permease [Paraliobacillus ryukyuensis]|uniref:L-asparagine transporter-like permease n=1 Tax=Paraliobacillus ryukyuensis TaxID=200904 RepID=A0A366ED35_9BACI|nr:amino acid permease [Paraliobacillus ryukyuensis]RBP00282.1 L-asparagine transporter-like permease [Paraliobacillus ryukyuensis]
MKNHHLVKQAVQQKKQKQLQKGKSGISWWQLSLIGIGSIIGAGFFLGTSLSIKTAGPAILFGYLIAGVTTYFVFSALAEMTINDPQLGSFRTYARKAYGHIGGFLSGWMYWLAGVLIMSSEIVALSTFTQFWFPDVSLWLFSIIYTVLGIGVNLLGAKNFGQIESIFAVIKLATLLAFIGFGALFVFGILPLEQTKVLAETGISDWFPQGVTGMWKGMIFIFFSFGGIAVVGVTASELKNKSDVAKAGKGLLVTLVAVYFFSLFFVFQLVNGNTIDEEASPFVTALTAFEIPYLDAIFNSIIISAAFSTMVGAFFSVTHVLVALAKDRDAPAFIKKVNKRGVATRALLVTTLALGISICFSFVLPDEVYEYVTTSAGVMLLLNWFIILASQVKLRPSYQSKTNTFKLVGFPYTSIIAMLVITIVIGGAFLDRAERIGVLISAAMIVLIIVCYQLFMWGRA